MNKGIFSTTNNPKTERFYYGTRISLNPGDLIRPGDPSDPGGKDRMASFVHLTPNPDAAIWAAELADGDGPGRVYAVEPTGQIENASESPNPNTPSHLSMSHRSRDPLRVINEITEWALYHGTRADLKAGDLIKPGHRPNYGNRDRKTTYVYLARTLDAAIWAAELAAGEGRERIYLVEPTGPIEDDPNVTNARFRGNPTKSYRSGDPLRIIGEVTEWQGHAPDVIKVMKDGLKRLEQQGIEPIDD